jgi:hypothetical protein
MNREFKYCSADSHKGSCLYPSEYCKKNCEVIDPTPAQGDEWKEVVKQRMKECRWAAEEFFLPCSEDYYEGFEHGLSEAYGKLQAENQMLKEKVAELEKNSFVTEDGISIEFSEIYPTVWVMNPYDFNCYPYEITKERHEFKKDNGYLFFSTEKAAKNHIVCNKPCLSLSEVWELLRKTEAQVALPFPLSLLKIQLKNLVKSKL